MTNRETPINQNPMVRPKQVLLVGLGGIGGRTVDKIMSILPEKCKKYTNAIAIDTDLEELEKLLPHIPNNHKIALGVNSNTNQSVTIGDYLRMNKAASEWFVQGKHLETIEKRNTAQGAKQIRMVSKVALAATNDSCGMQQTLNSIVSEFNKTDGASLGRGLLVMVVCSIAGGTGAGTVLQFPLYLEQAISEIFPDEDVQIECSMLLPGLFSRVQSSKNFAAGKTNAYAVIRELMSFNSGKLKRGDLLPSVDFGEKADNISPYSRVLFFDSASMGGDTLAGDLDTVYIPKIASALNEYLFGAVSGKITSALDNTLSTVYESGGTAIFGSVGSASLVYPRATYTQYAVSSWISRSISKDWTEINEKAKKQFNDEYKKAVEHNAKRPVKEERLREIFCNLIEDNPAPFYKELMAQIQNVSKKSVSGNGEGQRLNPAKNIVEEFWKQCQNYLIAYTASDKMVERAKNLLVDSIENKASNDDIIANLKKFRDVAVKLTSIGYQYEKAIVCPTEAENGKIFTDNKETTTLYNFIKSKKLHPIMVKYFLCKLYELAKKNSTGTMVPTVDDSQLTGRGASFRRAVDNQKSAIETSIANVVLSNFSEYLAKDLELYLAEYEDMFDSLSIAVRTFEEKKECCINDLPLINEENGTVLAGGKLSMLYVWRNIESAINNGDDLFVIDDELDLKIHELVYRALVKQIKDLSNVKIKVDERSLKIRTKYENELVRELVVYYTSKLHNNYSHMFPKNVIEAALLECGLRNAYKIESEKVDFNLKFNFQAFIDRNPQPYNITTSQDGLETDAEYLTSLLSATVGKSKPFCGRVEDFVEDNNGQSDYTNRLLIVNRSMLRTREDMTKIDENGIPVSVPIENELIKDVSSSKIGSFNVNTKFVDDGISPDVITSVTSISGLLPKHFVAFLPSDTGEHAPTKEHSYYSAYKFHLDNLTTKPNFITPHLHRNWHMAGVLSDFTDDHTDTYNRQTAEAFMYGFIFDLIRVAKGDDGKVLIGEQGASVFYDALGGSYTKKFELLDADTHADFDNTHGLKKENMVNNLLVKIYDFLATAAPVREAIISYGEQMVAKFKEEGSYQFVKNGLTAEKLDDVSFKCILDVIAGYYNGTRQLGSEKAARADKNTEEMFTFLFKNIFQVADYIAHKDNSDSKSTYEKFVHLYYDTAVCDDDPTEGTAEADKEFDSEEDKALDDLIVSIIESTTKKARNPFNEGSFDRESALHLVHVFLNK